MASLFVPMIHVRRTKTAGFQVCYLSASGRVHVLLRNLAGAEARLYGRAASRVYEVPVEVDDDE